MKRRIDFFWCVWFFCVVLTAICPAEEMARGVVFEDKNHNLKCDAGERGVPQVMVSNQRDVVLTDERGRYQIPVDDETVIFVTQPAGYSISLSEDNLPLYYYIHQPNGSPAYNYEGVKPTGVLPESVNFPLFKTEEKKSFDVIVFGDPQPFNLRSIHYMRDDILAGLVGTDAAFSIALGDIVSEKLDLYGAYTKHMATIGHPQYTVPGNHDTNIDSADDLHSLETYKSKFGPTYYSMDYGKAHFVIMDSVEFHGTGGNKEKKAWYRGFFGERQLTWLKNDLQFVPKDKIIILCMHIAPYTILSGDPADNVVDSEKLFEILQDREHLLILTGHNHTGEHHFLGTEQGWKGKKPLHEIICITVCGSWWCGPEDERGIPGATQQDGSPNGHYVFHFDGNEFTERFIPASLSPDFQVRVESPGDTLKVSRLKEAQIVANVFDGSERSVVICELDGSRSLYMERKVMKSPYFDELLKNHKETFRSWVNALVSNHIWTAPMPVDLKPGLHTLVIRAKDQFGRTFTGKSIFEVE
ncbi:MAG: calcineurin-like phosphoesterase family protein [Candidatus Sumerlaeota bacterium]|nr:calcineurin-like phosphoesterase family protein [Candidatus Sumerlaeota bacterium]